jgi:hypothetical protein
MSGPAMQMPHRLQAALGFILVLTVGSVPSADSQGGPAADAPQGRATPSALPGRQTLASYTQNAWAHVECSSVLPGNDERLRCQIGTLEVVRGEHTDSTAEPATASEQAEVARSDVETRSSRATEELARLEAGTISTTPEHKAYWTELAAVGQEMKAASDTSAVKAAGSKMREIERNTCRVAFGGQELTFSRAGQNRWLANPGPQGSCHEVVVHVLEVAGPRETPSPRWLYTQKTVSAALDLFPWCRAIKLRINRPRVYGAAPNHGIEAGCKYLTVDTVW